MMPKEGAACPTEPFPPPVDQDIPLSWGRLPYKGRFFIHGIETLSKLAKIS
jgi:hypothetical protein